MKKLFYLIVISMLIVSLFGCSKSGSQNANSEESISVETKTEESSPKEDSAEASEKTATDDSSAADEPSEEASDEESTDSESAAESESSPESDSAEESSVEEANIEEGFFEALRTGLYNRWKIADEEMTSFQDIRESYEASAKAELDELEGYDYSGSQDAHFVELADKYIAALKKQVEGAQYFAEDAQKYNESYDAGKIERNEVLKAFVEEYSFSVEDKYAEYLESVLDGNNASKPIFEFGEFYTLKSPYGSIKLRIDSVELDDRERWSNDISEDEEVLAIEMAVENIDYDDGLSTSEVQMAAFWLPVDVENYTLNISNSYYDKGQYEGSYDIIDVSQGAKKKVVLYYFISNSQHEFIIHTTNGMFVFTV